MAREDCYKEVKEVDKLPYCLSVPYEELLCVPYQLEFSFMADEVRPREGKAPLPASEISSRRNWHDLYQK